MRIIQYSVIFFMLSAIAAPAWASDDELLRYVTVQGEAEQKLEPDEAVIIVEAFASAKSATAAQEESQDKVRHILSVARDFGIEDEQMKALRTALHPRYEYRDRDKALPEQDRRVLVGYDASTTVELRTARIEEHGTLLTRLTEGEIDRIEQVYFQLKDMKSHRMAILADAVTNAREKADMLARSAGAEIGAVLSIQEGGVNFTPVPQPVFRRVQAMALESAPVGKPSVSLPGLQTVSASVTVTYALED